MEYLFLIISLCAVIFGADTLVSGAVAIARKLKISDFVIGAVIVGIGTSLPELIVSATGAWQGNVDIAVGNVVGSNIFNVLGILGLTAMLCPTNVSRSNLRFELPFCIFVSVVVMLLAFNFFNGNTSCISRVDGVVLLILFVLFLYVSFLRDKQNSASAPTDETESASVQPMWLALLKVVGGLVVLIVGCDHFVENAVTIATRWGVNEAFISITLIACGTSLPEWAASIAAAIKRNTELALGNIIGSNIFNITFILGVSSQISPLGGGGITSIDYAVMIVAAVLPVVFGWWGKIFRTAGVAMFLCFVAYTIYLLRMQGI